MKMNSLTLLGKSQRISGPYSKKVHKQSNCCAYSANGNCPTRPTTKVTIQINRYISDAEIEAYAIGILQKYGRQYKPITAPPVPIEDIIDLVVDIPIVHEAIPDHHGSPVLAK